MWLCFCISRCAFLSRACGEAARRLLGEVANEHARHVRSRVRVVAPHRGATLEHHFVPESPAILRTIWLCFVTFRGWRRPPRNGFVFSISISNIALLEVFETQRGDTAHDPAVGLFLHFILSDLKFFGLSSPQ